MQMAYKYLCAGLMGYIILSISFALASAEDGSDETGSKIGQERLVEMKANEWRIVRKLSALTHSVDGSSAPIYGNPAFTLAKDGKVTWHDEIYDRYVEVSSAAELTAALAEAKPSDFIHLLDGLYQGNFVVGSSGTPNKRIALYGTRRALLDGQNIKSGYGVHLTASYWTLFGFTILNSSKGLVMDIANHNIVSGIEIYQIGDEGLHIRRHSSYNLIEKVWIHDVGLINPQFGEGIYIGSALSNWPVYSNGMPDRSDHNRVIGNLLGPNLTAEGIDIKEGTTGGVVRNNSFLTDHTLEANSWIDVKGNEYEVSHNLGTYEAGTKFRKSVDVLQPAVDWGQNNSISDNHAFATTELAPTPFFATERADDSVMESTYLILVGRSMPYTFSELAAYFPDSIQSVGIDTLFLRESLLVGQEASLQITLDDAALIRLLSSPERFVTITGFLGQITIEGSLAQQLDFESWGAANAGPDLDISDGRAYIYAAGGRMDIDYGGFFNLGYEEGTVSGVAWKSLAIDDGIVVGRGNVTNTHFVGNYFGAYTFEAIEMRWIGNTFADNLRYGFDPHDFSNYFLVENNIARNNGGHGIIFSRGCNYNVLRGNKSFDNDGHGIMLDDGKVIPDSDNERYLVAVPSNHNVIEDNFVANNQDGIVLEGGESNIIRNNSIIGPHRYGLRFKDSVSDTLVVSNTIEGSTRSGMFIYNSSMDNQFQNNTITFGSSGIAFQDSPQNTFTSNIVKNISGSAIVLNGDVSASVITGNTFSGSGKNSVRTKKMTGIDVAELQDTNDFSRWRFPLPVFIPLLIISAWSVVFLPPLFMIIKRIVSGLAFAKR